MKKSKLLEINEVAYLLITSPASINNKIYRGEEGITVPFSLRIGNRRFWLPETVHSFLKEKEIENKTSCFQNRTEVKSQGSIKRL
jgi:hypothetical protein